MPYKSQEEKRKHDRDYIQKKRTTGYNIAGITEKAGTTSEDRIEFIKRELNDPYLIKGIEGGARLFKDREVRYERAYRYKLWKEGRKDQYPALLHSLTEGKLEPIYQSLKQHRVLDKVYLGVGASSLRMDAVGELLDVTG